MKFLGFKKFRPNSFTEPGLDSVVRYLSHDLVLLLDQLNTGLQRLSLEDNFENFTETVTITAGTEVAIPNRLRNATPSARIILRADEFGLNITDGPTDWDSNFVYLKNFGASTGTVTVIFLK